LEFNELSERPQNCLLNLFPSPYGEQVYEELTTVRVKTSFSFISKRFDVVQKLNAKTKLHGTKRGGNLRNKNAETNYAAMK
jgi:hypothetical protein